MITTKSEYDEILIHLFNLIISNAPIKAEAIPNCTEQDLNEILYQCSQDGLILGFSMDRVASGDAVGQQVGKPYVTLKGLTYIDSIKQAKALEVANSAKFRSWISVTISALALLASMLANADKIVHNVKAILSYLGTL